MTVRVPRARPRHRIEPVLSTAPPRLSPHTCGVAIVAGAGAVALMWGAQAQLSARLDALFATGAHLAGLLGAYGVVVMLLLMARIPAVEHGVGADQLARWHAWGGRLVFTSIAVHMVLALFAYAAYRDIDVITAGVGLLGYPGLAAAAAGTVLLLAVGVTSARAVRRRISHESWRAVHLATYLSAALCFVHQLGGPDVAGGGPFAVWFWSLLHAQAAVLLVWYRLVVPVRRALRHDLRVSRVRAEAPGIVTIEFTGRFLDELQAESGQFFRWRFLTRRLWRTALPFSLSAPVRDDQLRITVKAAGDHSRRVRRIRPGVRVMAAGPFGALTAHRRKRRKVLLLAGGVGIAPLRALFETLPGGPGDLTLLYRASNPDLLVLREELQSIAQRRGAALHYLLGPSDADTDPLSRGRLRALVPDLAEHDVFLCGPPGMTTAATLSLLQAGVPEDRIHCEQFAMTG
ncbi:ferric reductase-like transmembrane domain-containing protein [Streptomyces sp. NBC_00859]|uniref:ferredoxin reductase family protein n=1 Tax=Streptomyces sp. NBC_00859 TaxID=2903682 RepID=UPI00386F077C|nr:ferredoxin reductase family protein [Streptomyces sp. NBC_00859]